MRPAEIAAALRKVPEHRLKLIDMVVAAADQNGHVDYRELSAQQPGISDAIDEARNYARRVEDLRRNVTWATQDHRD